MPPYDDNADFDDEYYNRYIVDYGDTLTPNEMVQAFEDILLALELLNKDSAVIAESDALMARIMRKS